MTTYAEHDTFTETAVGPTVYVRPGSTGSIVPLRTKYENFIGGEWIRPLKGGYAEDLAPATGLPIAEFARSTVEDVDLAVAAATKAFPAWAATTTIERAGVLNAIADRLEQHLEQIAVMESWENGKPVRETLAADIPLAIDHFRYFAAAIRTQEGSIKKLTGDLVSYHFYEPIGVVAQIIPWNFPILMAAWKLAPAIAAGNTVVLKPASATPISILYVMELIQDLIPPGVINVINGSGAALGRPLVEHDGVGKVAFTGSTATGREIMGYAIKNIIPTTMELGGKSPNVFFDDVARHKDDFYAKAIEGFTMFALNKGEIRRIPRRCSFPGQEDHRRGPARHVDRDGATEQRRPGRQDLWLPGRRRRGGRHGPHRWGEGRDVRGSGRRLLHPANGVQGHERHADLPGGDLRARRDSRQLRRLRRGDPDRERHDLWSRIRGLEPRRRHHL
jgi:hypothetical protein